MWDLGLREPESWSKGCRGCEGVRLFDLLMRYAEHSPPSPAHLPEAPQVGGSGLGFSSPASPGGGGQGGGKGGGDWPLVPGSEQSVVTLWWGRLWRIGVEAMLF